MKRILYDDSTNQWINIIQSNVSADRNLEWHKISFDSLVMKPSQEELLPRYDLLIVSPQNLLVACHIFYKCHFIFCPKISYPETEEKEKRYIVFPTLYSFLQGTLYENNYMSLTFERCLISIYDQLYVRDHSLRFFINTLALCESLGVKTIVELGTARVPLNHHLDELDVHCCHKSHSTYFWIDLEGVSVESVDSSPYTVSKFKQVMENLPASTTLDIHIEDELKFLKNYNSKKKGKINLLYINAWDKLEKTEFKNPNVCAVKHLRAYLEAKPHLSKTCMVIIDGTDLNAGDKGRLAIPQMLKDNFIILWQGRHTLLYRGSVRALFRE